MSKKRAKPLVGDADSLRILEALRLGVVPRSQNSRFTVGRDNEFSVLREDLDDAAKMGSARVFLGDYGCGKTHMLECIEEEALSRGFLTSRVILDAERIPPSQPKRVYTELVRRLRFPDVDGQPGLETLIEKAVDKLPAGFLKPGHELYHAYLSPIISCLKVLEDEGLRRQALDWLEGHSDIGSQELQADLRKATKLPIRLYALKDFRPWAHLYSYLVGGLAYLAQRAGYKGLVVLFDEAEFYALLRGSNRDFADLLFGYYAAAALGPERSHFDVRNAKKGGHEIHRSFQPGYRDQVPLYCAFAMTEDPWGVIALKRVVGEGRMHRLNPLGLQHYQELSARVVDIYKAAYPEFKAADTVQNPMGQVLYRGVENGRLENPRQVLKFILEMLDVSRLARHQIGAYVEEVVATVCR